MIELGGGGGCFSYVVFLFLCILFYFLFFLVDIGIFNIFFGVLKVSYMKDVGVKI